MDSKKVYNYSEKKEQSQDLPNLKNGDKLNITKVDTNRISPNLPIDFQRPG